MLWNNENAEQGREDQAEGNRAASSISFSLVMPDFAMSIATLLLKPQ